MEKAVKVKNKKIESFIQIGSGLEYGKNSSPQKENNKCFPKSNHLTLLSRTKEGL